MTLRRDLDRVLTTRPKQLGRRGREAPDWRDSVQGYAPRLGPREYIGTGITRAGRFAKVDPLRTPQLWNRWRWLGLAGWALTLGGAIFRAWRQVGGPRAGRDAT